MADAAHILVTGATGFNGDRLVRRLLAEGEKVAAIVRPGSDVSALASSGVTIVTHDGSIPTLVAALTPLKPRLLYHLASLFIAEHRDEHVEPLITSNLLFPCQVVDAALQAGCRRMVNTGTAWQHLTDDDYDPVCLYAATKQALETLLAFYVKARGLSVTTLKLFDTYGPGDPRRKLLSLLRDTARSGEPLGMSPGGQRINLVHVDDVVAAFRLADRHVSALPDGVMDDYAVRGPEEPTVRELVDIIGEVMGKPLPVTFGARPYRGREVMLPWQGPTLPGWQAKVSLRQGLPAVMGN